METVSEDAFVLGVYGKEYTLGLQNYSQNSPYLMAVATLKHFVANSLEGPHWDLNGTWNPSSSSPLTRHSVNAKISLYDLHSTYLRGFQTTVIEGGAAGIMCSYNRVNGVPSCANEYLLKQTLRKEWKFRGYITSDSGALDDIWKYHHYAKDWDETVCLTLEAGCDVESAGWGRDGAWRTGGHYIKDVPRLVRGGLIPEAMLDRAVRHALDIRFRLGLFDPIKDQPLWHVPPFVVQSTERVQLAKEATAQGLVALKNERQILPLDPSKTIGLVGPHISTRHALLGNYLGEICKDDPKNSCVTTFQEGFVEAASHHGGTILDAIGCEVFGNDTSNFKVAMEVARKSDVVVFIGGLNLTLEGEGRDRPDTRLPIIQVQLLKQLTTINPNIVLLTLSGAMVAVDEVIEKVPAFISAGYPGAYGGEILPKALLGLIDKSAWGKLSTTWYHNDFIDDFNMLDFDMSRAPGRTYRYYRKKPLFPFGYGLNPLTTFELTGLDSTCFDSYCRKIILSVQVMNNGNRPGDEVIMAYFIPPTLPAIEPASKLKKELIGFERVHVLPGSDSSVMVSFEVTTHMLEMYDDMGERKSFPGTYTLQMSNGIQTVEPQFTLLQDGAFELHLEEGGVSTEIN